VDEDQEVLARADDVPLDLIVKVAEAIALDCRDSPTTFGIYIDPVDERDRIADLPRVCRRNNLRALALPLRSWPGCRSVRCEIDGRTWHSPLPKIQSSAKR